MNVEQLHFTVGRADTEGTHLQGHLRVPFARLVQVFGEPEFFLDCRVTFWWQIEFHGHIVATVYDWKASSRYAEGSPTPDEMRLMNFDRWSVGGKSRRALALVLQVLGEPG